MNHQETPAGVLARNVFDTLLERDDQLVVGPALAAEMPKLVAPTTWEFKLRSGVRFHNGEPMDAEAVKFSLERLVDPKLKLRGSPPFSPIDRVEIVDAMTVRVHTKAGPVADPRHAGEHRPVGHPSPQVLPGEGRRGPGPQPGGLRAVQVRALGQGRS